ncbi:hypothetical protein K466DRAFT_667032 [Polyporus arcularius HHB13444]|uniref:F-box domain-containing protein n=1 Tax=Polyporus arcularius HHB13444 TaxID=1314778 RepID=A0A5C3NZV2_9APHY|nr:hypothetical protein K466DRAFT_667032 [Polyporus arcularius HHB13444]
MYARPGPDHGMPAAGHLGLSQGLVRRGHIGTFPNEVLIKIFTDLGTSGWTGASRVLLPAMSTCRKWRDVIRGTPELWNKIHVIRHLEWLGICLERSQQLPIHVSFHWSRIHLLQALSYLHQHKDRIASINVHSLHCEQVKEYVIFPWDMLQLKTLSIVLEHEHADNATPHSGRCPPLVLTSPSLEELTVHGLTIDGHAPAFSSLRRLSIRACSGTLKTHRLPRFLDILKTCVSLEELDLQETALDAIQFDIPQATGPMVVLPRLRDLFISGKVEEVSNLLSHMEVGPSVNIYLETDYQEDLLRATFAIRNILPLDIPQSKLAILRSATRLLLEVPNASYEDGVMFITATRGMDLDHKLHIAVRVSAEHLQAGDGTASRDAKATYFLNALEILPTMFPTAPVHTLVCRGEIAACEDPSDWLPLCAGFPRLTTLVIDDSIRFGDAVPLFRALASPQSPDDSRPVCRFLESIWICNTDGEVDRLEEIRKCLMWRAANQVPLKRLRLEVVASEYDATILRVSEYQAHFAQLVPNSSLVIWDIYNPDHVRRMSRGIDVEMPFDRRSSSDSMAVDWM